MSRAFLVIQLFLAALVILIFAKYPGPWNLQRWVGTAIALPSLILLFTERFQLGSSFSVAPQARHLVTHGIYSRISNPIYFFGMFLILGFLMVLQKPFAWIILPIILVAQILRARKESRVLEEKFGDEYREYRRKTWF